MSFASVLRRFFRPTAVFAKTVIHPRKDFFQAASAFGTMTKLKEEHPAVSRFREYLRCNTMHPKPDYTSAVEFLKQQADDVGLAFNIFRPAGDPIVIMSWIGQDPSKPSLLLNSHMDVVPVFLDHWTYPPFSAHKTEDGKIYARGSQDMKCVGMQHLEVVRRLKAAGKTYSRSLHLCFVPDEEIGGVTGMQALLSAKLLDPYNVGFVLDEGLASGDDSGVIPVYYGERAIWQFEIRCTGNPGHGSRFIENNAAEKFRRILNSFLTFRDEQEAKLKGDSSLDLGDVTTVNCNMIRGGVQINVVPDEMAASFDVRLTPNMKLEDFDRLINQWVQDAGEGVSIHFIQKHCDQTKTDISPSSKWWKAFSEALDAKKVPFRPEIFPAATDSRHLRAAGYPALGVSYMPKTPVLLHDHDEFLHEDVFLEGIDVFEEIIARMASVD